MDPVRLEIEREPFSIAFRRGTALLMVLHVQAQPVLDLRANETSIIAVFPHFTMELGGHAHQWVLTTSPASYPVEVVIELPGHWYGLGELIHQRWPLEQLTFAPVPLQTWDNGPVGLGSILTPAWYSSNGALIIADSPVSVGFNEPSPDLPSYRWSFNSTEQGPFSHRPFRGAGGPSNPKFTVRGNALDLKLLFSENAVTAHQDLVAHFGHPITIPPEESFTRPTWTTWARYKTAINQDIVLRFSDEIIGHDYPYGVLEIDDRWQTEYGDLGFDRERFPAPTQMIDKLHEKGFKVTAWVMPFLSLDSLAFRQGAQKGWLVRASVDSPYLIQWWQGRGGLLDVSNPKALEWFFDRLEELKSATGLDGFKFDAGEACFLPADARSWGSIQPNDYTRLYVDAVAAHYQLTEVRSGWRNQRAPLFFRQWDKATAWGLDNGLHSVLTGILSLGMAGYPFILPDMVGGNEYQEKADPELIIRWTQLNALLPAMQFSLAPWDYGQDSDELCRRYALLHVEFAPKIIEIARSVIQTGTPIIRPAFWNDPSDELAQRCDNEFMLSEDILVAPVLSPGLRKRDVYLPRGNWRDHWTGTRYEGPLQLPDYSADLSTLPFFERAT